MHFAKRLKDLYSPRLISSHLTLLRLTPERVFGKWLEISERLPTSTSGAGQFIFSTWTRAQARKPGGRVGPELTSRKKNKMLTIEFK